MESSQPGQARQPQGLGLGVGSGIGLSIGAMVGAGVFVSAGFMAQTLSAGWILWAWIVGGVFAAAGAVAYAEISRLVPRSGGEYRYLSSLVHPAAGYIAGWATLLFGMCAPLAANALGAAAFIVALGLDIDTRLIAAGLIVIPTAAHAFHHKTSKWFQDGLALIKVLLVIGFIAIGLVLGTNEWPSWTPPSGPTFEISEFMTGLFFVGFAYAGWNAAVYTSGEFRNPARDVPRSMVIGLAIVALLYVAVNWVFVANLSPAESVVVTDDHSVTLGHLIAVDLLGDIGGRLLSVVIVLAFMSAISAMAMIGPRVYAEMAEDGFLPSAFGYRLGKPPIGSVLLQGAVAIGLVCVQSLRIVLLNASAILILFTALACAGLLRARFDSKLRAQLGTPRPFALACAIAYVIISIWMLSYAFANQASLSLWLAVVLAVALASYLVLRRREV